MGEVKKHLQDSLSRRQFVFQFEIPNSKLRLLQMRSLCEHIINVFGSRSLFITPPLENDTVDGSDSKQFRLRLLHPVLNSQMMWMISYEGIVPKDLSSFQALSKLLLEQDKNGESSRLNLIEQQHQSTLIVLGYSIAQNPWKQQSTWYRALGLAHGLGLCEQSFDIAVIDELPRIIRLLQTKRFRHLIFHRVAWFEQLEEIFDLANKNGTEIILDLDDQLLDSRVIHEGGLFSKFDNLRKVEFSNFVKIQQKMLNRCDRGFFSTENLCQSAKVFNMSSTYVPNWIPDFYTSLLSEYWPNSLSSRFSIFYGPGSLDHKIHFSLIADSVYKFLQDTPDAIFVMGGGLQAPKSWHGVEGQILLLPKILPEAYLYLLGQMSVALAPLQMDLFSQFKSWIKLLEASYRGVPWLASPTPDYLNFEKSFQGLGGLVIERPTDWYDGLRKLYSNFDKFKSEALELENLLQKSGRISQNLPQSLLKPAPNQFQ